MLRAPFFVICLSYFGTLIRFFLFDDTLNGLGSMPIAAERRVKICQKKKSSAPPHVIFVIRLWEMDRSDGERGICRSHLLEYACSHEALQMFLHCINKLATIDLR